MLCKELPNGLRHPSRSTLTRVVRAGGGTREHHFAGTNSKPRKLLKNATTPTTPAPAGFAGVRVHAVLGSR